MYTLHTVEGFILKKKILLEKDTMVTLFTQEAGKVRALAKGIRKFTSRRAAHVQTGNLIRAHLSESHGILYLQSSALISGFLKLRTPQYFDHMYLYLAALDALLPENQQELELYRSTKQFFIRLNGSTNPLTILRDSLQNLIHLLGYADRIYSLDEIISIIEENTEKKLPRHVIMT